jgi:hypothetical protein
MHRLKDIAVAMDCHVRTAKRWWKRLRVPPDVTGHGPHRWTTASFNRLMHLWATYYQLRGTTPQIVRAKYAGTLEDKNQLDLLSWKPRLESKSIRPKKEKRAGRFIARRAGGG